VILVGVAGEFVGSMIGYTIGRTGGRALVDRYGKYVLISSADIDRAHGFLTKRGDGAVVVGRILPLVRTFVSLVAGIGDMAAVPFRDLHAHRHGGVLGRDRLGRVRARVGLAQAVKGFTAASFVVLGLVVVAIAVFLWHRWRVLKRSR